MTSWCVHAASDEVARPHRVQADDALHAALTYAERWLGGGSEDAVTLFVQDEATGAEHCLTLDLGSGEARACG